MYLMEADHTSASEVSNDPSAAEVRTEDGSGTVEKIVAAVIVLGALGLGALIALAAAPATETGSDGGDHGASQYRICINQVLNLWRH